MKAELEAIMHRAGYEVSWRSANQPIDSPSLAVVDFSGVCTSGVRAPLPDGSSLASTVVSDGRVLPFSRIDCAALTRAMGAVGDERYGRAMARVLAHELYHVLTQTTHHGRSGLGKPSFSNADLVATQFEFEEDLRTGTSVTAATGQGRSALRGELAPSANAGGPDGTAVGFR